ncbi:MAG TPA: hypothetical protein VHB78_17135 [Vicinamibacterales bacterium]|jgi:hypothetical protein|nr:hypothetical protein [Vicinamibacterales bacterium]
MTTPSDGRPRPDDDTGVPGVRTWTRVYVVVIGSFVLWIALLSTLMLVYS